MASYKISYQWLPVFDKYRYGPLPVSVDFLQNVFDIVFLLVFIWYWNWDPLLVVLYYVIETLIMCLFTSIKWGKSNAKLSVDMVLSAVTLKTIAILTLCTVVGIFSYGQISAVHDMLGMRMALPSWEVMMRDEKQFMIGVVAIVLQQAMEYYKYQLQFKNAEAELLTSVLTPVLRIFVQQFAVMLALFALLLVSFIDLRIASIMIALLIGLIKIVFGQLQLIVVEK